ncbi:MAG TPA: diguanylate cyclase, partial [Hydrogenothermaceae bacterium]|nr:diguanylate cyclase [Hydrogenothermaceae bacterium]
MKQDTKVFKDILIKVYDNFYYRLISDPYFGEFFKNKDVEEIKRKQRKNLIKNYNRFIKGNLEEVKQNYIQLAKLHDELGLDFNSYMDSLSELEILILKEIFQFYKQNNLKNFDIEYFFISFEDFFDLIRKYSAAGYLDNLVHREKKIMDEFIEANIDYKLYEVKDLVDTHLDWKEDILDFLIDEKNIDENQISVCSCKATSWLEDRLKEEKSKEKKEKLKKLQKLHYKLHKSAEKLVSLKKEEKFFQLVYEYNNFVKTSLIFLSSFIAYTTSQQIKKLQRDPLTHLLSRGLLKEIFLNVMDLSILSGEPFAVTFIDIDNFKKINDKYGH